MAITVGNVTGKLTLDAGSSANISFGVAPNAGSTIIVYLMTFNDTTESALSVTDNQTGNTYVKDVEQVAGNASSSTWASIWRATNVNSSGTFTVTVTLDNSAGYATACCVEVRGLSNSTPLDQSDGNNDGGTPSTSPSAGPVTTTQADEYIAACTTLVAGSPAFDTGAGGDVPSGYTGRVLEDDGNTHQGGEGADKIRATTGSENPGWTLTATSNWAGVVATYKGAGAAAPAPSFLPARAGNTVFLGGIFTGRGG